MENFKFEQEFEEELMERTLAEAFTELSPSDVVRKHCENKSINKKLWEFFSAQGLLGMLEPKNTSADMNLIITTILAKEAGKRLLNFPVSEHVLGVYLLKEIGQDIDLADFEMGDRLITIGWKSDLSFDEVNDKMIVNGKVESIPFALDADTILVPVKNANSSDDDYVLELKTDQFKYELNELKTSDLTYPIYQLELSDLPMKTNRINKINVNLDRFYDLAHLMMAAELQGIGEEVLNMTLDYMKEREQFGGKIGRFQAVKHMLADMHLLSESSKVTIEFGSWTLENEGEDKEIISSIAKSYISDATRRVIQDAIQLHGGVGFTWEHDLHLYLKRSSRLSNMTSTVFEERDQVARHLLGGRA